MGDEVDARLEIHRKDYEAFTGRPFEHFYCPILHVDEDVPLQMGHIINEAFEGSPKAWVVQRCDVDNFYGTYFESDFEIIQYSPRLEAFDVFANKKLYQHFKPKIYRGNILVKHFPYRGGRVPLGHTLMEIENAAGDRRFTICIRATSEDLLHRDPQNPWNLEYSKDIRIAALVSLIKAAHLTLFSLLGYTYAGSAAGILIGKDILGRFYRENRLVEKKKEIIANAIDFFREFKHMVRPIDGAGDEMAGTLLSGEFAFCASTSSQPWGFIVYVKMGELRHAVLLPHSGDADLIATYYKFLMNDTTQIHMMHGMFDREARCWRINPRRIPSTWNKPEDLYPLSAPTEFL